MREVGTRSRKRGRGVIYVEGRAEMGMNLAL